MKEKNCRQNTTQRTKIIWNFIDLCPYRLPSLIYSAFYYAFSLLLFIFGRRNSVQIPINYNMYNKERSPFGIYFVIPPCSFAQIYLFYLILFIFRSFSVLLPFISLVFLCTICSFELITKDNVLIVGFILWHSPCASSFADRCDAMTQGYFYNWIVWEYFKTRMNRPNEFYTRKKRKK